MASYKDYFLLADKYLETSKLLLNILMDEGNPNTTLGIGNSEEEALAKSNKNTLISDVILFIPTLFITFQSVELFAKGILLLNNIEFPTDHNVKKILEEIKNTYGENSDINKAFKNFHSSQTEITKAYKKHNKITTTKELYESLRYPENNSKNKQYDYYPLINNHKMAKAQYKVLIERINEVKKQVLEKYK